MHVSELEIERPAKRFVPVAKQDKEKTQSVLQLRRMMHNIFADAYLMGLRNQAIHWHATGPLFYSLHTITEEHYKKLTGLIDALAEKMRAMDMSVPTSLLDFTNLTHIQVNLRFDELSTQGMVEQMLNDLETVNIRVNAAIEIAERAKAPVVIDLLTELAGYYDHEHWLLKSLAH